MKEEVGKEQCKKKRFVRKHVVDRKKESKGTPTPLTISNTTPREPSSESSLSKRHP